MTASAPANIGSHWWRKPLARVPPLAGTIRGRILVAFLVMSLLTGALGGYAAIGIRRAGVLVARTFDHSLMSINYARAAAADFASMRAMFVRRWMTSDQATRQELDRAVEALERTLAEDLAIAAERAGSARAASAATKVWTAVTAWNEVRLHLDESIGPSAAWEVLDRYARQVDLETDLLINYTAGDGFTNRQQALEAVDFDIKLTFLGTGLALLLSGFVAWLLAQRIVGPVAAASVVAGSIAEGKLDVPIPPGACDELGDLLRAMASMRGNIREMMEREVALRRSAQARLADAVESSREGVVVVDRLGKVALANSRAKEFMSIDPDLLERELALPSRTPRSAPKARPVSESGAAQEAHEVCLPDRRWLRVSLSQTQDGGLVAIFSDISVIRMQQERLRATNLRLDAALDNMSQGLCMYDTENLLKVANRRFCEIFGIPLAQVRPGMSFRDVLQLSQHRGSDGLKWVSDDLGDHAALVARRGKGTELLDLSDGRVVAVTHQPLSDGGWIATYEDVTERRRAEERISFMARHDSLTGLPNRNLLHERIESAAAQLDRDRGFALLCLDLDNFKQVNDTLGHTIGDELLRSVAQRLQACLREADTVARLGGDEFAIVQPGVSGPEQAAILAERIMHVLSAPYDLFGHRALVGVSCGIALAPQDGRTGDKLLKNADLALYRAKADGRGTFKFYDPEMDIRLQARRALELDLRDALEKEEFEVFYQPIYESSLTRITGFEALLRWRRPNGDLISPAEFIPIAEEIGLIIPLGEWALRRALEEAAKWPQEIKIAVNVSAVQFRTGLVQVVSDALAASGLAADRLELEITESVLLTRGPSTLTILHELRALGVRIAMDDFGTGYSSLSYLRSFPFDKIKIDRSFVRDLSLSEETGVIVRAIVSLATSLGMETTAEGVENEGQLARLRIEGCNQVQGFLFSPPVPAQEVGDLLIRSLRKMVGIADTGKSRSKVTIRGRKARL